MSLKVVVQISLYRLDVAEYYSHVLIKVAEKTIASLLSTSCSHFLADNDT